MHVTKIASVNLILVSSTLTDLDSSLRREENSCHIHSQHGLSRSSVMPKATQFTLSHEDRPGMLAHTAKVLGAANVNILACLTTTSAGEGVTHLIVDNADRAKKALASAGLSYTETDVLQVELRNIPGSRSKLPTASMRRDFCGNPICSTSSCSTCADIFPERRSNSMSRSGLRVLKNTSSFSLGLRPISPSPGRTMSQQRNHSSGRRQ